MATPKLSGMTPGALPVFAFSPMAHTNSPASHLLHKNRSSPASSLPFGTPGSIPAFAFLRDPHSGYPVAPDETKKREWEEVVRVLSVRRGRISQEGIERLAEAAGMVVWKEETKDGRQVTLSKDFAVVDIFIVGGEIKRVACTMANTMGPMVDLAAKAGKVLLADLTPSGDQPASKINSSLSAFSANLERLATLDRLSGKSKVNIFGALGGLYDSLRKVYELQSSARDANFAAYQGTGKPGMHTGGRIGLSIEYWRERYSVSSQKKSGKSTDAMDVDNEDEKELSNGGKVFRALVVAEELQPIYALPIPLLRNSNAWIPSDAEPLLDPEELPWLDPEIGPHESDAAPVVFTLKLDPPVTIAVEDEAALFAATGVPQRADEAFTSIDQELFKIDSFDFSDQKAEREIWTPSGTKTHKWRTKKWRVLFAKEITQIPIGHPRELANIFSVLRQHLLFQTLLSSVFNSSTLKKPSTVPADCASSSKTPAASTTSDAQIPYDITFSAFPPQIRIILPPEPEIIGLQIEVHKHGRTAVQIETGTYTLEGPKRVDASIEEKVRKVVEGTCDLGIVVEVVRKLVGGGQL